MAHINAPLDEALHETEIEGIEERILDLALERTGARNGAIFLADEPSGGLRMDFHIVDGVKVGVPGALLLPRKDGRPSGIAFKVRDSRKPYNSGDATSDPSYASFYLEVHSIAAVPILYQGRSIGVVTVAARERNAFGPRAVDELQALAASAAKFLRRAQLYREKKSEGRREFLIKGLSPEWLEVERVIERASPSTAPVLIRGESGTGKELVAHAIHFNSTRRQRPFLVVNVAAIPETLLESALFGHVKGAFTGAVAARDGQFVKADGGTLFLDEVGDLPIALQAKLLRAIEQGEILPLGSDDPVRRVDVRIVCATNRNLEEMIADGSFRGDLYHRIAVVGVRLPPLRTFKQHLPVIATVFLHQAALRYGRAVQRFTPEAMAELQGHDYPGNFRELRNVVDYAVLMAAGPEVAPPDLPAGFATRPSPARPVVRPGLKALRRSWVAEAEKRYLAELVASAPTLRAAARNAGISAATFYRLLREHGIELKVSAVAAPRGE